DRKTFFNPSTRSKVSCFATCSLRCTLPPLRSSPSRPYAAVGGNSRSGHLLTLDPYSTWHLCTIWKIRSRRLCRSLESRLRKTVLIVQRPRCDLHHEALCQTKWSVIGGQWPVFSAPRTLSTAHCFLRFHLRFRARQSFQRL